MEHIGALPVLGLVGLNQVVPLTNYPASSQYAVGVGGTVLHTDGAGHRTQEYAWTFGGGSSLLIGLPAFQQGVANNLPCVQPVPGKPCRAIPEVAAQSGDVATNGYAVYSAGSQPAGGGTSLSSPLWLGMWARVRQGGQGQRVRRLPALSGRQERDERGT